MVVDKIYKIYKIIYDTVSNSVHELVGVTY